MKKFLSLLMVVALGAGFVVAGVGCGDGKTTPTKK